MSQDGKWWEEEKSVPLIARVTKLTSRGNLCIVNTYVLL